MAGAWIQWAFEDAPNAETASNDISSNVFYARADSIKVDRGTALLEEKGKTIGVMGRGPHLGVGSYTPKVSIKGLSIRPSDIMLPLGLFGGDITSTAGDGSAVTDPDSGVVPYGATRHVVAFETDTPRTVQFICKDAGGKYWKVRGAALASATLVEADNAFTFDLELEALYADEITNPSLTPSFDSATPFRRGDQTVTWLSGSADTKDFELKLENGLEVSRRRDTVSDYPDLMMFANDESGDPALTGTITKRTMVDADWDALEDGTQFESVVKFTHRENVQRAAVTITSSSVASPSVITCAAAHHLPTGDSTVVIAGHTGSTPSINGTHVATRIDATTFSIPVNVTVGGTGGTVISDTAYAPKAWIEMPGVQHVAENPDDIANVRRRETKFDWEARVDLATATLATITVVNGTAAYETYA